MQKRLDNKELSKKLVDNFTKKYEQQVKYKEDKIYIPLAKKIKKP
jgi:hypothetical protein